NLDIVVLTSLWEGLPCVFSEAMATALPIVATNVDGAREAIIDGDNGFLHAPHDIEGMAKSVLKLAADPELRDAMGRHGKGRVTEFDINTSVSILESAYRKCLSELRLQRGGTGQNANPGGAKGVYAQKPGRWARRSR